MRTCGASESDNKNEIEEGVGRSLVFQFVARKDSCECDYMKKKRFKKIIFFKIIVEIPTAI